MLGRCGGVGSWSAWEVGGLGGWEGGVAGGVPGSALKERGVPGAGWSRPRDQPGFKCSSSASSFACRKTASTSSSAAACSTHG